MIVPFESAVKRFHSKDHAVTALTSPRHAGKMITRSALHHYQGRNCRAAPWGVVQRVTRFHLKLAINDIDRYVTIRQHDPQLTSAETQARCLAAVASGAFIFGPPAEEFDFATIPEADRLDAVARAKKDWMREVDEATRDLEDIVHRTVVRGLIGIAELQAASDQVFAYLHPTGPLARLVERLRPA